MVNFSASDKTSTGLHDDKTGPKNRIGNMRMVKLRLVYRSKTSLPRYEEDPTLFESADLGKIYFPIRALPLSIVYHIAIFCAVFYLQVTHFAEENTRLLPKRVETRRNEPEIVMLLPILGSGFPFESLPAAKPKEQPKASPKTASKAPPKKSVKEPAAAAKPDKRGLVYPGPQPMFSDPPDPTNRIQTLLQPAIEDPAILAPPLSLPNVVQFAGNSSAAQSKLDIGPIEAPPVKQPVEVKPPQPLMNPLDELRSREPTQRRLLDIQPAKVKEAELKMPPVKVAPPSKSNEPKLVIPPMVISDLELPPPEPLPSEPEPKEASPASDLRPDITEESVRKALAASASPAPEDPLKAGSSSRIASRLEETPLPQTSALGGIGTDQEDLLALTPLPAPIKLPIQIPSGEARGNFAISPEPNLDTSESEPGTLADIFPTESGIENGAAAPIGDPASDGAVRNITFGGDSGSAGSKDLVNIDMASGLTGSTSAGSAQGNGTGTGRGVGTGKGPFSGITIMGGSYDPGTAINPDPVVQASKPLQTSYGVTVISTENSGGGLPYVGVFSNEQIYTVYLDMREKASDTTPSWILEFALFPGSSGTTGVSHNPAESKEGLILPFPITKKIPDLPTDLVRNYLNELVIVYAVINAEGKAEQLSVKQSPDSLLNTPIMNALSEWIFRPAQLNGEPIAIKTLLGIPLWIPQQSTPGIINLDVF